MPRASVPAAAPPHVEAPRPRRLVAAYLDPVGRDLTCGFEGGAVVRTSLRKLGIRARPPVALATVDEFHAGVCFVREDGSQEDCAADLILYVTTPAYRASQRPPAGEALPRRVASRAAALRRRAGLSQRAVAAQLGVAPSNYARLEAGRHLPSVSTLLRLAAILRIPLDALVGESR